MSENLTPSFTLPIAFRFASLLYYIFLRFYLELLQRILFLSYLNSNNYKLHLCLKLCFFPSYLSIITLHDEDLLHLEKLQLLDQRKICLHRNFHRFLKKISVIPFCFPSLDYFHKSSITLSFISDDFLIK